jgi:hypothetical protein
MKTEYNENLMTAITYNILFANDIACGAVVQFVSDIRKSPSYRHDVKRRVNGIETFRRRYEQSIKHIVGDKMEYYMEACDEFTTGLEHDIRIFYITIKQALDNQRYDDSETIARMQWSRAMVQAAAQVWIDRTEEVADLNLFPPLRTLRQVRERLSYLNLNPLRKQYAQLIENHFAQSDFITCPEGQKAFDIICRKLYDAKSVLAAAIHD